MSIDTVKSIIASSITSSIAAAAIFYSAKANDNAENPVPLIVIPVVVCQINNPKEKTKSSQPQP